MAKRILMMLAGCFLISCTAAAGAAQPPDEADASPEWQQLRQSLFGSRPIATADDTVLQLEAPYRAEDAATVPIAIRSRFPQSPDRYVKTEWLIIDRNPAPVAATFHFVPESGRADVETRVRVEQYTFVRAIAELNDGSLHMVSRFVKASGGCSAPAGKDPAAAAATLGRMKLRVTGVQGPGQPLQAQLMISHPNTSGLAMNQITRLYPSPHFVRQVKVTWRDKVVLLADVDFSISENPNFRFYFEPSGEPGALKAEVVDNEDMKFESQVVLNPAGGRS